MDIQFCDLCNESVPLGDFALNRAFRRGDRVICAACDAAMSGSSGAAEGAQRPALATAAAAAPAGHARGHERAALPAAAVASGSRSVAGIFGLVFGTAALAAVAVGGALALERVDRVESASERLGQRVTGQLEGLDAKRAAALAPVLTRIDATSEEASRRGTALEERLIARIDELGKALTASAGREEALRSEITALRTRLDGVRDDALASAARVRDALQRVDKVVEFHGDRLIDLEERIRDAGARALAGGPGIAAPGAAAAPAAWRARLPELTDPDPGIRLDAASILAETEDPEVIPHLLPLLDDDDLFVRMVVCQSLGKLEAKTACPGLIERLMDESITVREAAVIALRRITDQSFGYEHDAREAERKRKAEAWRAWWRRSGDDFLASPS